jgi:hypothetical protein
MDDQGHKAEQCICPLSKADKAAVMLLRGKLVCLFCYSEESKHVPPTESLVRKVLFSEGRRNTLVLWVRVAFALISQKQGRPMDTSFLPRALGRVQGGPLMDFP